MVQMCGTEPSTGGATRLELKWRWAAVLWKDREEWWWRDSPPGTISHKTEQINMIPVTPLRGDRHCKAVLLLPVQAIVPDFPLHSSCAPGGIRMIGPQDPGSYKEEGLWESELWWLLQGGTQRDKMRDSFNRSQMR
jgi:hypothetical protein